jgi:succinate---hydroxymethylglutarate CoA-transferase
MDEAFSDPAIAHTDTLDETPASTRTPPPLHGQHTDEVLSDAGFSTAEIADLRRLGAI